MNEHKIYILILQVSYLTTLSCMHEAENCPLQQLFWGGALPGDHSLDAELYFVMHTLCSRTNKRLGSLGLYLKVPQNNPLNEKKLFTCTNNLFD